MTKFISLKILSTAVYMHTILEMWKVVVKFTICVCKFNCNQLGQYYKHLEFTRHNTVTFKKHFIESHVVLDIQICTFGVHFVFCGLHFRDRGCI